MDSWGGTMNNIIDMFPKKHVAETGEEALAYWLSRNKIISESFVTSSVWEKQQTLDTVLKINNELYELVLKLKGKLV